MAEASEPQNNQSLGPDGVSHPNFKTEKTRKAPRVVKKKDPAPSTPLRAPMPFPLASFTITSPSSISSSDSSQKKPEFGPRLGAFTLKRRESHGSSDVIRIETPGMICGASRGIVKHLSRDNVARAKEVEWIHVPFEDFLELPTPVPTLHPADLPLHTFLTHPPQRHVLSLSLRDAGDNQNMPANTNAWVQAKTVRGVRKVSIQDWIKWCKDARPDLIWAFVDMPKTLLLEEGEETPTIVAGEGRQVSQKRVTKSLERSVGWIQQLLAGLKDQKSSPSEDEKEASRSDTSLPPIIAPLVGGSDSRAREEFSRSLAEKQDSVDTQRSGGFTRLDDGIFGYSVELVDLPTNLLLNGPSEQEHDDQEEFAELLNASLTPLSPSKIRIAHTAPSPHAILQLILTSGFDLFDVPWAMEAADLGIALDIRFPVEKGDTASTKQEKLPIGLNLFEERFSQDFSPLGSGETMAESWTNKPVYETSKIIHSSLDHLQWDDSTRDPSSIASRPFTRAYIHHLLHTHEMGAYALLQLHNRAVIHEFFNGIRDHLSQGGKDKFRESVVEFYAKYDSPQALFEGARLHWKEVELARGKGRLKRERDAAANLSEAHADPAAVAEGIEDAT